jgi:Zn-dependent metalloprotease
MECQPQQWIGQTRDNALLELYFFLFLVAMLLCAVNRQTSFLQVIEMACLCSIVPPFLLEGIANSETNAESIRTEARTSLEHHHRLAAHRHQRSVAHAQPYVIQQASQQTNSFIPQDILQQVSDANATPQTSAKKDPTLLAQQVQPDQGADSMIKEAPTRLIYDAKDTTIDSGLPGTLVRVDGQLQVGDSAINQAFDNIGIVIQFYRELFGWKSLDNQNGDVKGSVHVGNHM